MIKLENYEVIGWEHAVRGMRNPMNSWDKSDSHFKEIAEIDIMTEDNVMDKGNVFYDALALGENDLSLMKKLVRAGTDHRKFMRMITVYVDITAPLYWWKEFDTYKVGTVANSCSTMHKIAEKEFEIHDFSFEHLDDERPSLAFEDIVPIYDPENTNNITTAEMCSTSYELLLTIITALNTYRTRYLKTKNKKYWWQMIQLLPSSYNQRRTVMLNYEVLANIYKSRKNHKLDEWLNFCEWIKTLPYSELIAGKENNA